MELTSCFSSIFLNKGFSLYVEIKTKSYFFLVFFFNGNKFDLNEPIDLYFPLIKLEYLFPI